MTKTCSRCGAQKDLDSFYPNMGKCKNCHKAMCSLWQSRNRDKTRQASRKWYAENREKGVAASKAWQLRNPERTAEAQRVRNWRKKYGLTKDQYIVMMAHQEFRCAICDGPLVGPLAKPKPSVDHNHETGKVRGILCDTCNRGIGLLGDNSAVLQRAASYVATA